MNQLIRIGSENFVNRSELNAFGAFDLLFGGFHEFVYVVDFEPWLLVNGSWTGVLGHLMNDNRMWIGSTATGHRKSLSFKARSMRNCASVSHNR